MVLRKITVDNNVRYVIKNSNSQSDIKTNTIKNNSLPRKQNKAKGFSRVGKPSTMKNNSFPRKQNKNISQNNKKFLNNISASGFRLLK